MKDRQKIIQEMRNEFESRCYQAYKDGSLAFFDNSKESRGWIDTLIEEVKEEAREESKTFTGKVKPCWNSEFNGIKCLEDDERYGFFKSDIDIRPSSCTWIDKNKAEHLFKLFVKDSTDES